MAGRPGKKAQAQLPVKPVDEFVDEDESFEDDSAAIDVDAKIGPASSRRDWRDVEKYREQRELKRLLGDKIEDLMDERPARKKH